MSHELRTDYRLVALSVARPASLTSVYLATNWA